MAKNDFVFFWGGTFSQWAPSNFVIDGILYTTAEQYMMAKKAALFNDTKAQLAIMSTKDPREQKAIGRKVIGFEKDTWEAVCRQYVYEANYAKFTQNLKMKAELLATHKEIVEASPEDKIWGIGLHENDPKAWDKETWQGTNWLGEAIMQVRTRLYKELRLELSEDLRLGNIHYDTPITREVYLILEELDIERGGEVTQYLNSITPRLTICPNCGVDDFTHMQDCEMDRFNQKD